MRVMACSSLNKYAAKALANSVFPTPVVPMKIKEPMGLLGSCSPARLRRMASDNAVIASSWPMTRLCSSSSRRNNFPSSLSSILPTGIPVHLETTSAISETSTSSLIILACASSACCFSFISVSANSACLILP